MKNEANFHRDVQIDDQQVTTRGDSETILEFARAIMPHDLLFLKRDIRNPKVVAAWEEQIEQGLITTILAVRGERICGCAAVVRDAFSWSPHVSEIRIVTAADMRGSGLGRLLAQESLLLAELAGAAKVFARATADQVGALAVFQDLGFTPEALLRDHVRDAEGRTHDIAVLSLDLLRQQARHQTFGFEELG